MFVEIHNNEMTEKAQRQDRKFFFIRHGETDWNRRTKRLQGHTDIPLNEIGRAQAQGLALLVKDLGLTRLVVSDLSRAFETAQILSQGLLPMDVDSQLREVRLGVVEGLSPDEVDARFGPEFRKNWGSNSEEFRELRFPEGESRNEVLVRAQTIIHKYLDQYPHDVLGFVSHGFLIRSLAFENKKIQNDFFIPNCAVAPFQRDPLRNIIYIGATAPAELLQPANATRLE